MTTLETLSDTANDLGGEAVNRVEALTLMQSAVTVDEQRQAAVAAYRLGIPSALPDRNPFKGSVQNYRWGKHREAGYGCPLCDTATGTTPL